jgi:hypothetical protein
VLIFEPEESMVREMCGASAISVVILSRRY